MSNVIGCPQTPSSLILDMPLAVVYEKLSDEITLPLFKPTENSMKNQKLVVMVPRKLQVCDIPNLSQVQLHADGV